MNTMRVVISALMGAMVGILFIAIASIVYDAVRERLATPIYIDIAMIAYVATVWTVASAVMWKLLGDDPQKEVR